MSVTERSPLTRQRIADAALALIDEHGLDTLSMRKLGAELGVEAMSLYNHVENKADLLTAVADGLYDDVLAAYGEPVGDWKVHARALSHAYFDVASSHPRAVALLISPADTSGSAREFDTRIVAAAGRMTDDVRTGAYALATVSNWVIGTIVREHGLMGLASQSDAPPWGDVTPRSADDPVERFRRVAETITPQERFEEGLETVLAGLEARYFGPGT